MGETETHHFDDFWIFGRVPDHQNQYYLSYGLRPLPPAPDHCPLLQDCRFLALLQAHLGIFGTQTCHLAWLVVSLWRAGEPWANFGTLGSITNNNFEIQALIFIDFGWILVPMDVIWHAWSLYFGVLGDPGTILGRSWGGAGTILGRSWDIGGHKEGPCEVQAWILSIFWWFWGPILRAFWAFLDQKRRFFHIYFQVAFSVGFWV